MNIIPTPQSIKLNRGKYNGSFNVISEYCSAVSLKWLNKHIPNTNRKNGGIEFILNENNGEAYTLSVDLERITITGGNKGILYGTATLCQMMDEYGENIPQCEIEDYPDITFRCILHDTTRCKIAKEDTYKELIDTLAFYKYNSLQLYMEHSFSFNGMEEITDKRGGITADEMKRLDDYAYERGIELVPCQAMFGHLFEILETKKYKHLCELDNVEITTDRLMARMAHHVIDVSNPESFELVKSMVDELIPLFRSNKFNICCDEAWDLGKGKNKALVEKEGYENVYIAFVEKIAKYITSKGKQVMMWGDIVKQYPEKLAGMPNNIIYLNWFYEHYNYEKDVEIFEKAGKMQYLCPGDSAWSRFAPYSTKAFFNINNLCSLAKKHNIDGIIMTDWGDYGHTCHLGMTYMPLIYGAEKSWSSADITEEKFMEELSKSFYGDKSGKFCGILKDVGAVGEYSYNWYQVYVDFVTKRYANMNSRTPEILEIGLDELQKCEEALKKINISSKLIYNEVQNAILGTRTAINTCKTYRHYNGFLSNEEVIADWEKWYVEFKKLWLIRNESSDIAEIEFAIDELCKEIKTFRF